MGLGESTSQMAFFIGFVIVGSAAGAAFYPTVRDMVEARQEAEETIVERLETSLTVTAVSYDALTQTLSLRARNDGKSVVEMDAVTVVVDGVPRSGVSGDVDDAASTELWGPGETATVAIAEVPSIPDRVVLVSAAGSDHVLTLGDTGPSQAGVGMYVGAGGNNSRYFHSMDVGGYGTTASGVFKTKNAADTTVADVLRVYNSGMDSASVTLTGTQVSNATAEWFTWTVKNGASAVGTLDHRTASPSVTFALPAGSTYTLTLRLDLAEGSGKHNSQFDFGLTLGVG